MTDSSHPPLIQSCEELFLEHGDNYLGQGWTKSQAHTDRRRDVMLDLMKGRTRSVSLLDFGCGTGQLLEYMRAHDIQDVEYTGLDMSELFIGVARDKFPDVRFHLGDLLADDVELPMFDYIVMNGLFTYRGPVSFDEMSARWQRLVIAVMEYATVGVAFNVTSPYVDWERDDLFHAPMQLLADFVAASPCRYFRIRHDYELFETTVYAYRAPITRSGQH